MKLYFTYYFLTTLIFQTSCAKVEVTSSDEKKTYKFNAGLEYIKLPMNSFFIYKDSATGSTSYVKVTESMVEKQYVSPVYFWEDGYYYETYLLLLSEITGTNTETWFSGYATCYNRTGLLGSGIDNSSFSFYDGPAGATCFFYPFASDTSGRYAFIPAINCEGKIYKDVHRFTSINGLNPSDVNYKKLTYYWVKGIGIIKRESRTTNTIQTYNLIQFG